MPKRLYLKGQKFGRLLALEETKKKSGSSYKWKCQCDCGKIHYASSVHLKNGKIRSCGCLCSELAGNRKRTHGMTKSSEFNIWQNMRARCYNKNYKSYQRWGGRGIIICDRWKDSFENFYEDMGDKPENRSLDRIDNNGNYCKENCRWASPKQQAINRRTTHWIELEGMRKNIKQWGETMNIDRATIHNRLKIGWSERDAVFGRKNECQITNCREMTTSKYVLCNKHYKQKWGQERKRLNHGNA